MDESWLQFMVFVLVALVIGILITLGSSLLWQRQSDEQPIAKEPEPPLAKWGDVARETFWFTLGLNACFVVAYDIFDLRDTGGVWWLLPRVNSVIWTGAIVVWVWAVVQRRRNSGRSDHPLSKPNEEGGIRDS